uniref:Paraneoplastic antigen Ma-like N-terminal domain-containing protein n=1 Tax=Oreochromis aureus TaxID=47969 RepID=A0AAZ1XYU0_OREAU
MATKSNVSQPNLANWCRGKGLDQAHAILVIGVPEEEEISTVEETLEQVKTLGKVRVRGKIRKELNPKMLFWLKHLPCPNSHPA